MTRVILLSFSFLLFSFAAFASFPVNKKNVEKVNEETIVINVEDQEVDLGINIVQDSADAISPAAAGRTDNVFIITLLLWFFLGGFAAHRWYAKKPAGWNILFIVTLGGFGIWWIVDLINILTDNF